MILLVHNHTLNGYVSADILRAGGYQVMEAANGTEALDLLKTHPFDLLMVDILMPKFGGFALATRVQSRWPGLPIILSGYRHNTATALLNPPVEFLQKPIDASRLIASVHRMVAKSPL
jgi:CheY-like chemotaxis protein